MNDPLQIPLQRLAASVSSLMPDLVDTVGTVGLKFIDDNFRLQGYQGFTFQPWAIQKRPNYPRPHKILILTGYYRRSWRKQDSSDYTTLMTDAPQARALNEGVRGPVYSRSPMGTFGKTVTRNMNTPPRPVIGPSPVLTQQCEAAIVKKLINNIKHE